MFEILRHYSLVAMLSHFPDDHERPQQRLIAMIGRHVLKSGTPEIYAFNSLCIDLAHHTMTLLTIWKCQFRNDPWDVVFLMFTTRSVCMAAHGNCQNEAK